MKRIRTDSDNMWLDLSQAAELLGVHFTTLRRWVDSGSVPCIRTPGGRRRFRRAELEAFLGGLQHGRLAELAPAGAAQPQAIAVFPIGHLHMTNEPWYQKIGADERDTMRRGGQRLMAILMQYAARTNGGEPFLREGRRLAAYHGQTCRQSGLSLVETMQAFLRLRHAVFNSVYEAGTLAGLPDAETWRIYDRMNDFLDNMLLATIEAYNATGASALPLDQGA